MTIAGPFYTKVARVRTPTASQSGLRSTTAAPGTTLPVAPRGPDTVNWVIEMIYQQSSQNQTPVIELVPDFS